MLHIQTEETVAYKPTLARPLGRNSHYGVGEGRCDGCEPSIVRRRSCGRTTSSRWAARYRHTEIFFLSGLLSTVSYYLLDRSSFSLLSTRFILYVFIIFFVSSVSSCTRAAVVATLQPTAIQQQYHNNSSKYIVVRPCRPD